MNSTNEQVPTAIADQASEWLVATSNGPLDARDAAALAEWLRESPMNIEEFLGVSAVARDLRLARQDPRYSLDAILARARVEEDRTVEPLRPRGPARWRHRPLRRGLAAAAALAACGLGSAGVLLWLPGKSTEPT